MERIDLPVPVETVAVRVRYHVEPPLGVIRLFRGPTGPEEPPLTGEGERMLELLAGPVLYWLPAAVSGVPARLTVTVLDAIIPNPPVVEEPTFLGHPCTVRIAIAPPLTIVLTVGMMFEMPTIPPRHIGDPPEQRDPRPEHLPIRSVRTITPDSVHALRC